VFPLRESVVMLIVFICILVFCVLLPGVASAATNDSVQQSAAQIREPPSLVPFVVKIDGVEPGLERGTDARPLVSSD
jgi:hypothetical protein